MNKEELDQIKEELWQWIKENPNLPEAQATRATLAELEPLVQQLERHTESE